jgi:Tfp pilus assembly protein PilX
MPCRLTDRPASTRGAGSLAVLLVLLLAASIALLYANRALLFEQRAAANLVRATAALEAAEAGLAWTLALLNHAGTIDAVCTPSSAATQATDTRFATRYLSVDATQGLLSPAAAARPACVATGENGWRCACPAAGAASLTAPAAEGDFPAFAIEFAAGPQPGTVRLRIDGCSGVGSGCGATDRPADAWVRTEVLLATLGAVARPPYAAVTARGSVTLQGDPVIVNTDGAGLTVSSAGSGTIESGVQLHTVPGQQASQSVLVNDPTWLDAGNGAAPGPVSATRFFASQFALDRASYKALPLAEPLRCASGCSSADIAAASATGARVLWVDGPLTLAAPLTLGSATQPVVLIVDGALSVTTPVELNGLIYASSVTWAGGSGAWGRVNGALVSEGDVQLVGHVQVRRDAAVLGRLRDGLGLFAPVPGSWRDVGD